MKKGILTLVITVVIFACVEINAQENIIITEDETYQSESSALLDIYSLSKGILIPRLSSEQRTLIENPATGLLVFDTEFNNFFYYNGSIWQELSSESQSPWVVNDISGSVYLNETSYKVGIGTNNPVGKLSVAGQIENNPDDALFEICDAVGNPIFRVTSEGVRIYVKDYAKGASGGFAVGRYGIAKDLPDTTYLIITADSTRFYIDDDSGKASSGGFAVGRYGIAKDGMNYFNINGSLITDVINDQPGMFWYPLKEAFLVGRVDILNPLEVGFNSFSTGFHSKATGNYSQAMGFQSYTGNSYSTALGKNAKAFGINSFALGDSAQAFGDFSYAMGNASKAYGRGSFAFGVLERFDPQPPGDTTIALGDYSVAIGVGARAEERTSISLGVNTISSGQGSLALGYGTIATAGGSAAIGMYCEANGTSSIALGGSSTATNNSSFAVGQYCNASGAYGSAIGCLNDASGNFSTAIGYNANTNGFSGSFVIGASDAATTYGTPVIASANNQFTVRALGGYQFFTDKNMNSESGLFISPITGNVGIGTDSPTAKLHVNDVLRLEPRYTEPNNPQPGDIYFDGLTNNLKIYVSLIGGWKTIQLLP
jgi:hypothetical protein